MSASILVPTDFSSNADHALEYAMMLAKKMKTDIILLHAYSIVYESPDIPITIIAKEIALLEAESARRLKQRAAKVESNNIKCSIINKEGSVVNLVNETISEKTPSLVIMGTRGAGGIKEVIVGSNTAGVIVKTKCPVIAVPEGVSGKPPRHITYATAYDAADVDSLKKIVEIAKLFNAQLNVLHVVETADEDNEKKAMESFMNEVISKVPYNNFSFQLLRGETVEKALRKYLDDRLTNMLVISTHERSFLYKIFNRSVTKRLVHHNTKVPLLALHNFNGAGRVQTTISTKR